MGINFNITIAYFLSIIENNHAGIRFNLKSWDVGLKCVIYYNYINKKFPIQEKKYSVLRNKYTVLFKYSVLEYTLE